jgi:hypothetical protein
MRVREYVRERLELPLRYNTLKAQRKALGLSRAALARILEVDPSSVYRQELRNPMSMLWNYALRGLAAEAKNRTLKAMGRRHRADLAREDQLLGPSRLEAQGYKLTAEKMRTVTREQAKPQKEARRKHWRSPPLAHEPGRARRTLTKSEITAAADRAEARRAVAAQKNKP